MDGCWLIRHSIIGWHSLFTCVSTSSSDGNTSNVTSRYLRLVTVCGDTGGAVRLAGSRPAGGDDCGERL